jgi:K+-sensing histidine kinase KdpD
MPLLPVSAWVRAVDVVTPLDYLGTIETEDAMGGFFSGLIIGCVIGVVAILVIQIIADKALEERNRPSLVSHGKVFFAALILLAICGGCYSLNLEKSALLAFLLSVLLIAKLGGSLRGIVAAGIAALILAWFLPPAGTLWVSGLDNQLALALFILGAIISSALMRRNHWVERWFPSIDPYR